MHKMFSNRRKQSAQLYIVYIFVIDSNTSNLHTVNSQIQSVTLLESKF